MSKLFELLLILTIAGTSACSSDSDDADTDSCVPGDADGIVGGTNTVLLNVSDTAFAVGGVNSGSTQPNITVQNSSAVKLTVTNVGSTPHSFKVACIPSGLPAGCEQTSCFPDEANLAAIAPGDSMSTTFATPAVEGAYQFTSDEPGDDDIVGQFVLN